MKKGYYIHFQGRASIGISKKIDMQMEEFNKHFQMEEIEVDTLPRNLLQRVVGLLPWNSIARGYEEALAKLDNPDFIYVRRTVAERAYVEFFKNIKKKFPSCKIIIEIFTYPYDKDDFGKWNAWPFYIKELIYRKKLKKYVDRFVTYSEDDIIFGIPTIKSMNGVNVEKMSLVEGEYKEKELTMLGVAYMQRQHGFERVINGLNEYYSQDKPEYLVRLILVGDGPEKQKYISQVKKYELESYVDFFDIKVGEELDALYDKADVCLGAFGLYKVGYHGKMSALKTRECMAKGMPMVSGCGVDVLDDDSDYILTCGNNSKRVNINRVVDYFETLKKNYACKAELAKKIRSFAMQTVDMSLAMRDIIKFIGVE